MCPFRTSEKLVFPKKQDKMEKPVKLFNITPPTSNEKRKPFCQVRSQSNSNKKPFTTAKKNISEPMFDIEEIRQSQSESKSSMQSHHIDK